MPKRYDAVVIGAGPAGEVVVTRLSKRGMRVALVERELVGGECAYYACIPSKTLLRAPEVRSEAERAAGVDRPSLGWDKLAAYRDYMIRNLDDSDEVENYRSSGVDVFKGAGTIAGPGRVEVSGELLETERIVVATGSEAMIPPIDGLDQVEYWTNREATTLRELPSSVVVLGGGPVGIELSQLLRRFDVRVTLIESGERLLAREGAAVTELLADALRADGIELRLGAKAGSVSPEDGEVAVNLEGGERVIGSRLLVATGRRPRIDGLGLETVGIEPGERGIEIDDRCRAADGVWAVGDVTGVMPFTHVGMYQGRTAADSIAGEDVRASYDAIPRVVFSDPEVAAVGLTADQARERGIALSTARVKLREVIARPWTYEQEPRGELGLIADREREVLVGAWVVAPLASEWIHHAALAMKTRTPIAVLRDTVAQFPTFTEAYLKALEALEPDG
jgi:pyruvate/2-oxoglutarate dehydrogenase complex dihydrolipoamide dehydrogenase (E3) component